MTKFKLFKAALACAVSVMALAAVAPAAKASIMDYDWTFRTVGVSSGGYISGNVIVGIDTSTQTFNGAPGVTFPYRYDLISAAGSVDFFGAGGVLVQHSTVTGLMDSVNGPPDNQIFDTNVLGTVGEAFALDGTSGQPFGIPGFAGGLGVTLSPGPDIQDVNFFDVFYIAQGRTGLFDITPAALPGQGVDFNGKVVVEEQVNQRFVHVPEPFGLGLLGVGFAGVGLLQRRRAKTKASV